MRYVNDSKATNVAAALRALASFPGARMHVILGGRGKAEPYAPLAAAFAPGDRAYLIGEAADEIAAALERAGVPFERSGDLAAAVAAAAAQPRPRATSSCSRRPARASTSSRASSSAGEEFGSSCRSSRGEAGAGQLEQRLLVLVTLGLVAFGLVMVYSATSASAALGDGDPMTFLVKQGVYALVGVVLLALASRFDYHRLRALAPVLLARRARRSASPCSSSRRRSTARSRWFLVGPISVQPSELAKIALCVWACACSRAGRRRGRSAS